MDEPAGGLREGLPFHDVGLTCGFVFRRPLSGVWGGLGSKAVHNGLALWKSPSPGRGRFAFHKGVEFSVWSR